MTSIEYSTSSLQKLKDDLRMPFNSPLWSDTGLAGSTSDLPALLLESAYKADAEAEQWVEPILAENADRFSLFPIQKPVLYAKYKQHVAVFWTPEEVDLSKDIKQWKALDPKKQHFIKYVLGFFHGSDGIVMENLSLRFSNEVQLPEARAFYAIQNAMESIHCVAPETPILTDKGYIKIVDAAGTNVNVWNGEEFSNVNVVQTSPADKLYRVTLDNGMSLECTDGHKWLIRVGPKAHPERCKVERIETKKLKSGDVIANWSLPTLTELPDPDEFKNPYTHGFFCGDGSYTNKYPDINLYGVKQALLPYLVVSKSNIQEQYNRTHCYLTNCINKDKYFVPINYSLNTKLRWLEGYVDADGCTKTSATGHTAIQIGSINKDFLLDIQLMLTTLGINAAIKLNKPAGESFLPDGKGGNAYYKTKEIYVMYITCSSVQQLRQLGFAPKRLQLSNMQVEGQQRLVSILSIEDTGRVSPTYCFNEPIKHCGTFNGIVTGQSETYALLIDTYLEEPQEKLEIQRAIQTIPCVQMKAEWAQRWISSTTEDFATRLVGFAAVEGIFFSGSFCAIFWLKEQGIMPGLTTSNEFIARDEALHTEFACELFKEIVRKPSQEKVQRILHEAVKIEKHFITKALPCDLIGMNARLMSQYIEYCADRLAVQLGYERMFNVANPFDFMERISLEGKDNFFEKRVTSYAKTGVGVAREEMKFSLDADF
jgi:ribonucleotide reductase beta subunit family protein with ferritin-like domain